MNICATLQAHSFPFLFFSENLEKKNKKKEGGDSRGTSSVKEGEGGRERTEGRVKVGRPPDQEERDKGGPVCSTQRQIERIAFFVPPKLFHHNVHSPALVLPPLLSAPHHCLPTSKKSQLDLWHRAIQTLVHSKSFFSWSYSHLRYFGPPTPSDTVQGLIGRMLSDEDIINSVYRNTGVLICWGSFCVNRNMQLSSNCFNIKGTVNFFKLHLG